MPMVYKCSLAAAGNLTTNASANTETDAFRILAGVRNAALQSVSLIGKGAGLTAISGIVFRIRRYGTGSTVGTAMSISPADPGMQAAKATAFSRPTVGTAGTNRHVFGCGAAGPGGWVAENPDSLELLEGGGTATMDGLDASGTASLAYEFSMTFQE